MNESTLLKKSAHRLMKTGWRRGTYGDRSGPNCIVGAVFFESDGLNNLGESLAACCLELLDKKIGIYSTDWNDHVAKTKDEVIELLLDTAEELRLSGY